MFRAGSLLMLTHFRMGRRDAHEGCHEEESEKNAYQPIQSVVEETSEMNEAIVIALLAGWPAVHRCVINVIQLLTGRVPRMFQGLLARFHREVVSAGHRRTDRFLSRIEIVRLPQVAVLAVDEELFQLAAFGSDDRRATGHGFEIHLSERFTDGGVDEVISTGVSTGQFLAAEVAEETHAIFGEERLQGVPIGSVADDAEKGLAGNAIQDQGEEFEVLLRGDSSHTEEESDGIHLFFRVGIVRPEHSVAHRSGATRGIEQFGIDARLPDDHGTRDARVLHEVSEVLADREILRRVVQVLQTNELIDPTRHSNGEWTNVRGEIEVDVRVRRPNNRHVQRFGKGTAEHGPGRLLDDVNDIGSKPTNAGIDARLERSASAALLRESRHSRSGREMDKHNRFYS